MQNFKIKLSYSKQGSVLIEMLIVIAIIGIVAGTIGGVFYANQRGSIVGRQQTIEASLVQEAFEAIKSIVNSNDATSQGWNRIYCPPNAAEPDEAGDCVTPGSKGAPDSNPYKVKVVGNVWRLYQGAESITIGNEVYTRALHIENVSRDANGQIEASYSAPNDDPLTQKITVKVTPPAGTPIVSIVSFVTRSIKKQSSPSQAPGVQTDWSGGINCTPVVTSFGAQYCSSDANEDVTVTPGSIKILPQ